MKVLDVDVGSLSLPLQRDGGHVGQVHGGMRTGYRDGVLSDNMTGRCLIENDPSSGCAPQV